MDDGPLSSPLLVPGIWRVGQLVDTWDVGPLEPDLRTGQLTDPERIGPVGSFGP